MARSAVVALAAAALLCGGRGAIVDAQAPPPQVAKILADARQALGGDTRLSSVRSFTIKGDIAYIEHATRSTDRRASGTFQITCELPYKFVQSEDRAWTSSGDTVSAAPWDPSMGAALIAGGSRPSTSHELTRLGFSGGNAIYERRTGGDGFDYAIASSAPPPLTDAQRQRYLSDAQQKFMQVTLGMFAASFPSVPLKFLETSGTESGQALTVLGTVPARMLFDPITHLPARLGGVQYSDYRDVDGLRMPFRMGDMANLRSGANTTQAFVGLEIKSIQFKFK